jgi:hypothetical protein
MELNVNFSSGCTLLGLLCATFVLWDCELHFEEPKVSSMHGYRLSEKQFSEDVRKMVMMRVQRRFHVHLFEWMAYIGMNPGELFFHFNGFRRRA